MSTYLIVDNDGPLVVSSNYWDLPECAMGKVLLTVNAGAFRLLLPPAAEGALEDMRAAKICVVSRGPWPAAGLADALEVLFDDSTDSPYAIHTAPAASDRLPLDSDAAGEWTLTAWTRPRRGAPHLALERPCRYRRVPRLPWLRPWEDPSR